MRGKPDAILLVEFGEDDHEENLRRLKQLHELMGDLGFAWENTGAKQGGVVDILDPGLQAAITEVRTSGLNIMMSMKDEGKPVSFVEDCAVPLEHLAEYTQRLTEVFEKNGTRGTWYAHAGAGCLHVRPVLNLRLDKDVLEHFQEDGPGWQERINAALRKAAVPRRPARGQDLELASTEAILGAAAAGLGVAFVSRWSVRAHLAAGLVQIVPGLDLVVRRTFRWALPAGALTGSAARFHALAQRHVGSAALGLEPAVKR